MPMERLFRPCSQSVRASFSRFLKVEQRVGEQEASQSACACSQSSPTGARAIILWVVSALLWVVSLLLHRVTTNWLVVAAICSVVVAGVSVRRIKLPALLGSPGRERCKHKPAGLGPYLGDMHATCEPL